jgi:histidyl-tRNA synthetase
VIRRVFEVLAATDLESLRREYGDVPELRDDFARFERYREYLDALGVLEWVTFDLSIVRGLAYYTGIVFELFDARGELRAICGGGRYDNLLAALGGTDLPALGFGMGDVVLGELLRDRGLMRPPPQGLDFWVGADNPELTPDVMRIAQRLRGAGYAVEYPLRQQSLDKQRKAARAAGATRIIEVPDDYGTTGVVRMAFADPALAQAAGQARGGQAMPLDSLLERLTANVAGLENALTSKD